MHRRFIALVIGTALAVTGLAAAPGQADSRSGTPAILAGPSGLASARVVLAGHRGHDWRADFVTRTGDAVDGHHASDRHQEAGNYQDRRRKKAHTAKRKSALG